MHIFWAAFAALYVTALAFVAGQITGHVVIARQLGHLEQSSKSLVIGLIQFAGLVIAGLVIGTRRMRAGAAAESPIPEHSDEPRADTIASAIEMPNESADVEATPIAAVPVVPDFADLDRFDATDVFELQKNADDVRERSVVRNLADIADDWTRSTAPVFVPPAIDSVTTAHAAGEPEPDVVESCESVVEPPTETEIFTASDQRADDPASAPLVQPPPLAPYPEASRIITGVSREAFARAWVGGGALIVGGSVAFALGGHVAFSRWAGLLLAVMGLAVVARAASVVAARRRVGKVWVHLRNAPVAPGSELEGMVWSSNRRLRRAVRYRKPMRPARVRLLCVRGAASSRPETSPSNASAIWQKEVAVRSDRMTVSTSHLGIPFRFDVPTDVPEMSRPGDVDPIVWFLSIEMSSDSIVITEQFALPIHQREPLVSRAA